MAGRDAERAALCAQANAVYAYFSRRAASEADALELLRHTMVRAWRRIDRFPAADVRRQRIWLLAAGAGVLAQEIAESSKRPRWGGPSVEVGAADRQRPGNPTESTMTLRDAMPRLTFVQRELIALVHWEGLTLAEAGEVLGMDTTAASAGYSAARANLRAALEGARI